MSMEGFNNENIPRRKSSEGRTFGDIKEENDLKRILGFEAQGIKINFLDNPEDEPWP